jgi:hypothetical protein
MPTRKTIPVGKIVDKVNLMLAKTVGSMESRIGAMALLEEILHDTGNYRGYKYLDSTEVPVGEQPGIIRDPNGANNRFPDETRRQYFYKD